MAYTYETLIIIIRTNESINTAKTTFTIRSKSQVCPLLWRFISTIRIAGAQRSHVDQVESRRKNTRLIYNRRCANLSFCKIDDYCTTFFEWETFTVIALQSVHIHVDLYNGVTTGDTKKEDSPVFN